jgi:3-deoxy-D-manno-octulosonic-acid transferase
MISALASIAYSLILAPIWLAYYGWRTLTQSAYRHHFTQRLGLTHYPKAEVWIHGVSVGEANLALMLKDHILKNSPKLTVLITCSTPTAHRLLNEKANTAHCYLPIDLPGIVHKFINNVRPKCVFFIESELWPNYLLTLQTKSIPLYLMNARVSDRSFPRMQSGSPLYSRLLKCFTGIQPSSDIDRQRLLSLGATNQQIIPTANLKALTPSPTFSEKTYQNLRDLKPNSSMIVIVSTHKNEEALLKETINTLAKHHQIVIIPRHPYRSQEVKSLFSQASLYSEGLDPNIRIWIIDQIGLTLPFFKLANLVIMGGSFVPKGGHNPIEPAHCQVPIITGPHTHNFKQLYRQFLDNSACLQWDVDQLSELVDLDANNKEWQTLTSNANELIKTLNKQAETTLNHISCCLNKMT